VKIAAVLTLLMLLLVCSSLGDCAEDKDTPGASSPVPERSVIGRTMVIIPFDNTSPTPGLEWLGESFPETFHEQLTSPVLYVTTRDERLRAYDRQGVPAGVHPSRATLYRIAEQMDVDYAVLGSYTYDGSRLTATAQLLDMRALKLLPAVSESAPLADLATLQSALTWDLLRLIHASFSIPKDKFVAGIVPLRLDAIENYVQGMLSASTEEKVQHYREASRLNPNYAQAWLELGKTYYAQRNYEPAIAALNQIPQNSPEDREANFYLGLSAYAHGDYARSETAFEFVATRVPLAEVYNNLGVVAARRGQKKATDYFDRAIQNDPSDADYHFNLGVLLNLAGDRAGAARELHQALEHHPGDAEAKTLLDALTFAAGSIVQASATSKTPLDRLVIKHNYEEDAFRQMTTQMGGWAEQQFARSDPRAHARFHVELGKELLTHGFVTEAEAEFQHATIVDPTSSAPLMALARLDLEENKIEAGTQNISKALQLEPSNQAAQNLAAQLAEKAQQLSHP
jgi:tetratricopeptide (TPR) repeat protein